MAQQSQANGGRSNAADRDPLAALEEKGPNHTTPVPRDDPAASGSDDADAEGAGFDPRRNLHRDPHVNPDTRIAETRDAGIKDEKIPDWEPPSNLQAPEPRAGYVQRWVRTTGEAGRPDQTNLAKKHREGWRPRPLSTVPNGMLYPKMHHAVYGDVVGIEGMILMELPERNKRQRDKYMRARINRFDQSIDQDIMQVQRPNVPIQQTRKSTPGVGRRRPEAAED